MKSYLKYKGIHPGFVLKRELEKRSLKQRSFALCLDEHPQTINAILQGKRNLNTSLALKIECELGLEEGVLVLLQAFYDIKTAKEKGKFKTPDLDILRTSLFWDTKIENLDWEKQYKAVINRVFERGNEQEKNEILQFYGKKKVEEALKPGKRKPYKIKQPSS